MATFQSRYGKPVMQVEFGGAENNRLLEVTKQNVSFWRFWLFMLK
jgi:hypothetical protein